METKRIGKAMVCLAVILVVAMFSVPDVRAWNWATHAYIDDHLGKSGPLRNMNEIYGGTGPDVFNYLFEQPVWRQYLYDQTHDLNFMKVWYAAHCPLGKASAFGFISHNNVWGADSTAHHAGRTVGQEKGYVVEKASALLPELQYVLGLKGITVDEPTALELCHNIVEAALDILVLRVDPMIGKKLASSAVLRSPEFPVLLVKAYAKDFAQAQGVPYLEAVKLITATEKEFRKSVVLYGQALMQGENTAIQLISEQMADLAAKFLGLPPELVPQLVLLAEYFIAEAMGSCALDYAGEIEATIEFVREGLAAHHISY